MNVKSKSGNDNMLSMFVSSCLSVSKALIASSVRRTALSTLFKSLFNGDAIFAKIAFYNSLRGP